MQSTLSSGATIRDHILNPLEIPGLVLSDGLDVEITNDFIIELETKEYCVEVG